MSNRLVAQRLACGILGGDVAADLEPGHGQRVVDAAARACGLAVSDAAIRRRGRRLVADDPAEQRHDHDRRDKDERERAVIAAEQVGDPAADGERASRFISRPRRRPGAGMPPPCPCVPAFARMSAPVPRASSLPWSIRRSSSQRSASSMTWLLTTSVVPVRGELAEVAPELDTQGGVDAHGRLVEEEDGRLVDQRAGQRQPAAHAAREVERRGVPTLAQLDDLQDLVECFLSRVPLRAAKKRRFSQTDRST